MSDTKTKDTPAKKHKARLREIEFQKEQVELEKAWIDLQVDRYRLKQYKGEHLKRTQRDETHGVFRLETYVGGNVLELAAELQKWARVRKNEGKPVTLYLTSGGGSTIAGFALYDQLRTLSRQGHHVTTVVRGYAASMAGVLVLAGDTRLIGAESFVHVHEVSAGAAGKLSEVKDEVAFMEKMNQKMEDLYVERAGLDRKKFRLRYLKSEVWIDAEEAIKMGIAHELG